MKPIQIIIITLIVILFLCSLDSNNFTSYSVIHYNTPMIQPYYKSFQYNTLNFMNNNEDFLLAILGTDERKNEKSRSDVIMVLKYNAKENKLIVVSVPRDSKIPILNMPQAKINAASAFGGSKLQIDVLENLFKVNNMRYIHINFKGFTEIVDTIDGVMVKAEKDFIRDWGKKNLYVKKGRNILFGDDLLEYVCFRNDKEGDFGRIKRQQEVLLSFASRVLNPDNISKLPEIALIVAKNTDSDMNIFYIMRNLKKLKKLDSLKFEFYTLKTFSELRNGIWYEIIDEKNLELISDLLRN